MTSGDVWEGFCPDPVIHSVCAVPQRIQVPYKSIKCSEVPYKSIFTIKTGILLLLVHSRYEKQARGALRGSGEFEHKHTSPS